LFDLELSCRMSITQNKNCIVSLVSSIRRLSNAYIEQRLAESGVTDIQPIHGGLLATLYTSGKPLQMKEIPAKIGRSKSTVNSLADTLEKRGYVRRVACEKDARCIYLTLTDKAREFEPVFRQISTDLLEQLWTNYSAEETQILIMLLNKMLVNLTRTQPQD